jgi:actin-like ATPase involved in cell morphogenesis
MRLVYGIDFGTSNSAIMVGRPGGEVIRIHNPVESIYEVPTAVCLRANGKMTVGSVAQRMKVLRPAWYRDEFKRDIGNPTPIIFPPETSGDAADVHRFAVHELVAEVLRALREQAESEIPGEPGLVVITVPASWQAGNHDYMYLAAATAGFNPDRVRLVKEPEAAVAYAVEKHLGIEERTLLIYDLGGGTFDCAVVRGRGHTDFDLLGEAGGLDNIGGTQFDRQILELIRRRFPAETSDLLDGPARDYKVWAKRLLLRDTCENAKRVLSTEMLYEGLLTELDTSPRFELSRSELAELIGPMVEETIAECERLLRSLGMDWSDIDNVVPVGGSSRLPIVGETIARHSTRGRASVIRVEDPELAVAHGAVRHAFALLGAKSSLPTPARSPDVDYGDAVVAEPVSAEAAQVAEPTPEEAPAPVAVQPQPTSLSSSEQRDYPPWAPQSASEGSTPYGSTTSMDSNTSAGERDSTFSDENSADAPPGEDTPVLDSRALPPSIRYMALQASSMTMAWRSNKYALWSAAAASVVALLNEFSAITSPKDLRTALAIAAYSLVGLLVLQLLLTAWALNRALQIWKAVATASGAFALAATTHYFLNGWLGWTVFIFLLVVGASCWMSMLDSPISKMYFLKGAQFSLSGISLTFGDNQIEVLPWTNIESITQPGNLLVARLVAEERAPGRTRIYRLKYNSTANEVELFGRYLFTQADQILDDIRVYSGGRLSISTPPRRQSRSRRSGDR